MALDRACVPPASFPVQGSTCLHLCLVLSSVMCVTVETRPILLEDHLCALRLSRVDPVFRWIFGKPNLLQTIRLFHLRSGMWSFHPFSVCWLPLHWILLPFVISILLSHWFSDDRFLMRPSFPILPDPQSEYLLSRTFLKTVVPVFWLWTFVALWIVLWATHGLSFRASVPWVSLPGPTDVPWCPGWHHGKAPTLFFVVVGVWSCRCLLCTSTWFHCIALVRVSCLTTTLDSRSLECENTYRAPENPFWFNSLGPKNRIRIM